jgi:hypothetical protein
MVAVRSVETINNNMMAYLGVFFLPCYVDYPWLGKFLWSDSGLVPRVPDVGGPTCNYLSSITYFLTVRRTYLSY